MNNKIHQESRYAAPADRIYEVLTNGELFTKLSGAPAEIDATAGGSFSCFGGMIVGRNIECVPGVRLVQAWRATNWDEGVYSMVRFELVPDADGTKVKLEHAAFPQSAGEHLAQGWHTNYWEPMRKLLEG